MDQDRTKAGKFETNMNRTTKRLRQFSFYLTHLLRELIPDTFFRKQLQNKLSRLDASNFDRIMDRVNYYNRIDKPFTVGEEAASIRSFRDRCQTTYYFDLRDVLRYFDPGLKFHYLFGDIQFVPNRPSFVKSRPICEDNRNSVLLKLNRIRHFYFVKDRVPFAQKKDMAVWRGKCRGRELRAAFVQHYWRSPNCDVGESDPREAGKEGYKGYLSIRDHLTYKFIISIEGYDVASNLKWILSSNSLCFMRRPRFETWFCEGRLIPNEHYVLLRDDFADLEEKIAYYSRHGSEALDIIENAHRHVAAFMNNEEEELISLLVAYKYFEFSCQYGDLRGIGSGPTANCGHLQSEDRRQSYT